MTMQVARHSAVTDKNEKHLPRGFEAPTKGSLLAGAMPDVEKTNSPSEDGSILIADSSEVTGMKWTGKFIFRIIGTLTQFLFRDTDFGDTFFTIQYDSSTSKARVGTDSTVGANVIFISDGEDSIEIDGSSVKNIKRTGIMKTPDNEVNLDILGSTRNQNSTAYRGFNFFDTFVYEHIITDTNTYVIAKFSVDDLVADGYSAGWITVNAVQSTDDSGGEYGYNRTQFNFSLIGTSISTHSEDRNSDSDYPRIGLTVNGNDISLTVRISTGVGTGSSVFARVEFGVNQSTTNPKVWTVTRY